MVEGAAGAADGGATLGGSPGYIGKGQGERDRAATNGGAALGGSPEYIGKGQGERERGAKTPKLAQRHTFRRKYGL